MPKEKIKIYHNKNLFLIIIILIFLFGVFIGVYSFIHNFNQDKNKQISEKECNNDNDCVPAECCHPISCVSKEKEPNCNDIFCTMECAPGTLDCNQGSCMCVNGKCKADFR